MRRRRLEALAGPVHGQRYHYLRLDPHSNFATLDSLGFLYDSTLGFADQPGFRAGIAQPFRPWDLEREQPLRLVEIPLAAMDVTLAEERYLNLSTRDAGSPSRRAGRLGGGARRRFLRDLALGAVGLGRAPGLGPAVPPVHGVCPRPGRGLRLWGRTRRGGERVVAMSEGVRVYRAGLGRIGGSLVFLGLLATAPALLVLARLFPPEGVALALRLAAATACVLLLPGAILVRAYGRPAALSASVAGAFVWSLALLFGGLALTFAVDGSIETALIAVGAAAASRSSPPCCARLCPSRGPMPGPGPLWLPPARSSGPPSGGRRARCMGMRCSISGA